MSSPPQKLGQLLPTTSEQHSEEVIVAAEVADLSLNELAPPSSSSSKNHLLQHFSHPHPLNLIEVVVVKEEEEKGNNEDVQSTTTTTTVDGQKSISCPVCRDNPVSDDGPIYRCSNPECDEDKEFKFILHKSCAELPMKIASELHPQHRLELFPAYSRTFTCDICQTRILGFSYSCRPCDFDIHIKRSSLHKFEPSESHPHQDHSFIPLKPSKFTCDACGFDEERKMVSFLCTTCQFQVHPFQKCYSSSYPLNLKQILHSHKLNLTYSYQLDFDFSHKLCMICNKKMNTVLCVYYCSPCAYIAHVGCATLEYLRDDHFENQVVAVENTNEISRLSGSEGEDPKSTELQLQQQQQQQQELLPHFSHPHSLILSNEEPGQIDELCDGCVWPLSVPYYTCPTDQCNFSLHKQCAELPSKIRHPFHKHTLTLHPKLPTNDDGLFLCLGCAVPCNGFTYNCDECKIFIACVRCSLFSDTLSHDGHQCPLNITYNIEEMKCSACGLECYPKFICEGCNFQLDLRCASLPKTTMHKCPKPNWGIRPLKLTYSSVEDESGEYYCDICEERRDQNHWFYYCEACDYSCHPQCVLGGRNLLKFGKTHNLSIHPHPLTLVKKAKGCSTCVACHDSSRDSLLYVCAECDFCIHLFGDCTDIYGKQS